MRHIVKNKLIRCKTDQIGLAINAIFGGLSSGLLLRKA